MSSPARDAAPDTSQAMPDTVLQDQPAPTQQRRSSRASSAAATAALASSFADNPPPAPSPKSTPRGRPKKSSGRPAAPPSAKKGKQKVLDGAAPSNLASTAVGDATTDDYVPVASGSGTRKAGAGVRRSSGHGGSQASAELPPVLEGEESDTLRRGAAAPHATHGQEGQIGGASAVDRHLPTGETPPPLSAKARGKRKADAGGEPAAKKSKAPTRRRSRSVSVAGSASVDGGEEAVKPKVKRDRKPLKKVTKKSVRRPELPALFKIDNPNAEVLQEREKELQRGMDPELAKKIGTSLSKQSTIYKTAYAALEQELIRIQIEESVLRNVKKVVRDERDKLRYARGAG